MKVLVVGYGEHTKRRIIPALEKINSINQIHILSERNLTEIENSKIKLMKYEQLETSNADFELIIISHYPIKHLELFKQVKNLGNKFIIEKPITSDLNRFLNNDEDEIFYNKIVYESNAFMYHPIYKEVKKIIKQNKVLKIVSSFEIPQLTKSNYRYKKNLGGSSILDQGIYPISMIINLFNKKIELETFKILFEKKLDIDTSGFLKAITKDNIKIELTWGLNLKYKNELRIYCEDKEFYFPFIFSKPENLESTYLEFKNNVESKFTIGCFDQFQLMYEKVLNKNKFNSISELKKLKYKYKLIKEIIDSIEK